MLPADRFGVSTHILGHADPETDLPLLARHGFSLLELNLDYFPILADERSLEGLQQLLGDTGLRVLSFHFPYGATVPDLGNMDISHPDPQVREHTLDTIRFCAERLNQLGATCMVVHPSVGSVQTQQERDERLGLCAESLSACVETISLLSNGGGTDARLRIAVEALPPHGLLNVPSEVATLFEQIDRERVGLCLDVNHINLDGQDPVEFTRTVGAHVITTHLSDNDGVTERHWVPGKGVLPWRDLLSALLSSGYAGPLLFETSREPGDTDEETVAKIRTSANELAEMLR